MPTIAFALRDAPWLSADRAVAWTRVLALASVLALLASVFLTHGGSTPDPWHRPLAADFVSFWTAAKLALAGTPASAWNPVAHAAAQHASFAPEVGFAATYYAFFYPPPFLLICLPLALLPYGAAVAVWLGATGAACFTVVRALLPKSWPAALVLLAFPAMLMNLAHGQNGALSVALLGAATLQLDRRPWVAGAFLGTMCFKPQLALLIVPALIAARRWQTLVWAVVTTVGLSLASLLLFGEEAWAGFLAIGPLASSVLELGGVGFARMASTFAAARLLGAGLTAAWAMQALVSLTTLIVLLMAIHRRPGPIAEGAILATAACLATPFLLDYDLMLLAIPLAWAAAEAESSSYLPWEKTILVCAFLVPLFARSLATSLGVPVAPLVIVALFAIVTRRAVAAPALCQSR
jgi:hypothetical protein